MPIHGNRERSKTFRLAHGGRRVNEFLEHGDNATATVAVSPPIADNDCRQSARTRASHAMKEFSQDPRVKARVLVVDDRPENLLVYELILGELDEELVMAHSGEEALALVESQDFAVILLDVNMPGMDGLETAKQIRSDERFAHLPIIFMTAFADDFQIAEGYARGAVDYIQTPVVPEVLRAKVKVFADLYRMGEELHRRRNAEAARQSAERIRLILDSSLDAVVSIDDAGLVTGWNPQAATSFGWSREEALGKDLADLIIPERHRAAHRRGLANFLTTGEGPLLNRRLELAAIRRDGTEIPIELTISPLSLPDRYEFSAFIRDITDRKATEEQIRHYATELERSNRELDQFAYSASHDLRSPLRAIGQMASWITDDHGKTLPDEVCRDLGLIQRRVRRMQQLLDDILDYARAGRQDDELSHVDSERLVHEIVDMLAPPPGMTVSVGALPAFVTHRAPLAQVLRNLIGNAIKHHDRAVGHIDVSASAGADSIEFVVRDDGPGIPREYHQEIFQMFSTLKPRDVMEGSGMGLAMVRKILENRGGSIHVESAEGRGATFRFTWPRTGEA
jgi:two-component system sensor kinase FixL